MSDDVMAARCSSLESRWMSAQSRHNLHRSRRRRIAAAGDEAGRHIPRSVCPEAPRTSATTTL